MTKIARERNRRGEGTRLRADILAGATRLLEQAGTEEVVTLRAVAREVGISAPSIYSHFADREAIVEAIVDEAFGDFNGAIKGAAEAAAAAGLGPVEQLRAGCAAYLEFAATRPNRYQLLFQRRDLLGDKPVPPLRKESFELLMGQLRTCVEAGLSDSDDPPADASAIWVALHGFATLHAMIPGFPWPRDDDMLDRIVYRTARISPAR